MKKIADEINWAPVAAVITGCVFIVIACFVALYLAKSGAANIHEVPEAVLGYLVEQFVILLLLFIAATVVAFLSYFVYFKRQAWKKLQQEFKALSADPSFLSVLRKLGQYEKARDEIEKMKSIASAFDSKDLFNSKILREFIGSLPPV